MPYVSFYFLATHSLMAFITFGYCLWLAIEKGLQRKKDIVPAGQVRLYYLLIAVNRVRRLRLPNSVPPGVDTFEPVVVSLLVLLLISFELLLFGYLYTQDFQKEKFLFHASGLVLAFYFAIIFQIPLWLLVGFNVLTGFLLFRRFFYRIA